MRNAVTDTSARRTNPVRVLLAKPGLDGHDVGAKIIARTLMDAGFEVTYTGLKQSPEDIIRRVREERFDVLGLSILSGSHLPICGRIAELLRENELKSVLWIVGGNIPRQDHDILKELGVTEVFSVGSSLDTIAAFISERMS